MRISIRPQRDTVVKAVDEGIVAAKIEIHPALLIQPAGIPDHIQFVRIVPLPVSEGDFLQQSEPAPFGKLFICRSGLNAAPETILVPFRILIIGRNREGCADEHYHQTLKMQIRNSIAHRKDKTYRQSKQENHEIL